MEKNKNKTTTKNQFERIVLLLEQEPDIAKGFSRGNSGPYWDDLAAEVNSLGPPIRDGSGWKKVWADYKSGLKRKLAHNKREQRATGGGPNKIINLSELEEQAVLLTGLLATVEGIPGTSSHGTQLGSPSGEPQAADQENFIYYGTSDECDGINNTIHFQPSQPKKSRPSTTRLLELQVGQQNKFHTNVKSLLKNTNKNLSDLVHYQRQSARAILSVDATLKEHLSEQKRHNHEMEKIALEKSIATNP
ncbi:uncharacterized protein LOC129777847 [Toxorhynchites rutilus septentrionalis]|uniref:uncharacterized protein LOC129777847 n=1 Tax=Toxorhynchites rutilus septentrionalis TaxID=329112 RepID=UPI00247B104D|nr:uncharacterized protein LOC129777847 [Toxorhynchites rutilus septentrionalis]